jgi:ATP/maltotriose-dependent transcriptional regulator MalT
VPRDAVKVGKEWLMVGPLLETKLHVPRRSSGVVVRPRLSDRLARAGESPLTVVSAPAGFGKTTLLAEWLPPSGVWLSLDERDNDPAVVWRDVLCFTMRGRAKRSRWSWSSARQINPQPYLAMKVMLSGLTFSAARQRSPSFSRVSSSQRMIILPC